MSNIPRGPIAIIDDDPDVLDSLRFLLEIAGHSVRVFSSAQSFLNNRASRPACLILDHHMPTMTGLELMARLRAEGDPTPVALITGSPSQAIIARAWELGVKGVLEKPVAEDVLLRFVEAYC